MTHIAENHAKNRDYWMKFLLEEGQFCYPAAGQWYTDAEKHYGGVNKMFYPHTVAKTNTNIVLVERRRIRAIDLGE